MGQDKVKSNKSDVEKKDSSTKTASVTIFVIIGIALIAYVIYCFEAYKNGWFPFKDYVQVVPKTGAKPLGEVSEVSQDDLNRIQDLKIQAYNDYCRFYNSPLNKFPLPRDSNGNVLALVNCKDGQYVDPNAS